MAYIEEKKSTLEAIFKAEKSFKIVTFGPYQSHVFLNVVVISLLPVL
jgi:hypothetical protein